MHLKLNLINYAVKWIHSKNMNFSWFFLFLTIFLLICISTLITLLYQNKLYRTNNILISIMMNFLNFFERVPPYKRDNFTVSFAGNCIANLVSWTTSFVAVEVNILQSYCSEQPLLIGMAMAFCFDKKVWWSCMTLRKWSLLWKEIHLRIVAF